VSDSVKHKDFEDIAIDDFELNGYIHHPSIKADMAI
jgi:thymidylate synthase